MFVKDLNSLKYAELQKLAKSVGIKANQKVDKLMQALKDHYLEIEDGHENSLTDVKNVETTVEKHDEAFGQRRLPGKNSQKTIGQLCESSSESEVTAQELAGKPLSKDVPRDKAHGAPKKGIAGKVKPSSLSVKSPLLSPLRKMAASLDALKKATPSFQSPAKKSAVASDNVTTPILSKATKKRRRTFELDEPTLSAQNTPVLEEQADRRSSRQRTSQSDAQSVGQQEEPAKKRVRKNTYDVETSPDGISAGSAEQSASSSTSSPATKAMIEEIDANLPSAERKQKLLSALEQKIKNKGASPKQQSSTTQPQPSQIPRFMAFLANKKVENQKPVTPGNKDWKKIHKKEFSKFDSLDVYLERKQQRMDKLTGSAKGSATVSTRRRGPKIVKPVTRLRVPVAAVNPFVPTVTSTKNMTFNFTKTPVALKTPAPAAHEASPTPRKQGIVAASARKSGGTANRATPFIFTGNNTAHNTTVTSQKKSFDLKASLAKPLSWKPHTGRLQPLDINKPQPMAVVAPVKLERPSRQALASKTRPVNTKDVRRVQQLDRRNNQKYIDMMKRRGLLA